MLAQTRAKAMPPAPVTVPVPARVPAPAKGMPSAPAPGKAGAERCSHTGDRSRGRNTSAGDPGGADRVAYLSDLSGHYGTSKKPCCFSSTARTGFMMIASGGGPKHRHTCGDAVPSPLCHSRCLGRAEAFGARTVQGLWALLSLRVS